MKARPHYESNPRNNYGAVDYLEGNKVLRTVFSGLSTYKIADEIAENMNSAVSKGWEWARNQLAECKKGKTDDEILNCIYSEFNL